MWELNTDSGLPAWLVVLAPSLCCLGVASRLKESFRIQSVQVLGLCSWKQKRPKSTRLASLGINYQEVEEALTLSLACAIEL